MCANRNICATAKQIRVLPEQNKYACYQSKTNTRATWGKQICVLSHSQHLETVRTSRVPTAKIPTKTVWKIIQTIISLSNKSPMRRVVYPSIQKPFSLNSADSCLSSPVSFHPSYTRNHTSSPSQRYSRFRSSSLFRSIGIVCHTSVSP